MYVLDGLVFEVACPNYGSKSDKTIVIRKTLEIRERSLGLDHPHTISSFHHLALLLQTEGKLEEAETLLSRAFDASKGQSRSTELQRLGLASALADIRLKLERYDEATVMYRMVLERREQLLGANHRDTLESLHDLAYVLHQYYYTDTKSSLEEAEQLMRKAVDGRIKVLSWQNDGTLFSAQVLVQILVFQGKFAEAEPLSRDTYAGRLKLRGPDDVLVRDTGRFRLSILQKLGKMEEAEELQQSLGQNEDVA